VFRRTVVTFTQTVTNFASKQELIILTLNRTTEAWSSADRQSEQRECHYNRSISQSYVASYHILSQHYTSYGDTVHDVSAYL
jgi:inosine-uridine nucleoside N-ribohydrolase